MTLVQQLMARLRGWGEPEPFVCLGVWPAPAVPVHCDQWWDEEPHTAHEWSHPIDGPVGCPGFTSPNTAPEETKVTTETTTTDPTVRKLAEELIRLYGEEVERGDIGDHIDNHERGEEEHDALVDAIDKAITFATLTVTFHGDVP